MSPRVHQQIEKASAGDSDSSEPAKPEFSRAQSSGTRLMAVHVFVFFSSFLPSFLPFFLSFLQRTR
jgi:hypothetical protein